MSKIFILIVIVIIIAGGIFWWQKDIIDDFIFGRIQLNGKVKCYQASDCKLVYTGESGCPPCDLGNPDYKCVSPEQAKIIQNEWYKKSEGSSCEKCLPEKSNFNFECTCNSGICEKTEKKIDTSDWQTYRNEEYGFEVRYPNGWIFSDGYSQQVAEGTILTGPYNSFHISKENDYVSIAPEGAIHAEDENPKISFINIGGAKAEQKEWNQWPKYKAIRILDEKPSWLKEYNVIMVLSDKYDKIIDQILSTFKFINQDQTTENNTSINSNSDFWAFNMGDSIILYWADLPIGTTEIIISRGSAATGPWSKVFQLTETEDTPSNIIDSVDGTTQDWYYKLEALSATGTILRSYSILKVSKTTQ